MKTYDGDVIDADNFPDVDGDDDDELDSSDFELDDEDENGDGGDEVDEDNDDDADLDADGGYHLVGLCWCRPPSHHHQLPLWRVVLFVMAVVGCGLVIGQSL